MTGENQWEMRVASIFLKLHGGRLSYIVYRLKITDVNKHQNKIILDCEILGLMTNPILKWTDKIQ